LIIPPLFPIIPLLTPNLSLRNGYLLFKQYLNFSFFKNVLKTSTQTKYIQFPNKSLLFLKFQIMFQNSFIHNSTNNSNFPNSNTQLNFTKIQHDLSLQTPNFISLQYIYISMRFPNTNTTPFFCTCPYLSLFNIRFSYMYTSVPLIIQHTTPLCFTRFPLKYQNNEVLNT